MRRFDVEWMLDAIPEGRPSREEWAFIVALGVSTRGECVRRKVGAVILNRRGRIIGAGYNGSEPGGPSCLEGECPRGRHYRWTYAETSPGSDEWEEICRCERPWPCPEAVPPGSSYDTGPGACHSVHAELNARLDVRDKADLEGASMFVTAVPCNGCLKILRADPLRDIYFLDDSGVPWSRMWPFRE